MILDRLTDFVRIAARRVAVGAAVIAMLGMLSPAVALDDKAQVLTGGNQFGSGTFFTAPGLGNHYLADSPGPGLGEFAAQIRMPAGTLRILRARFVTQNVPSSGSVVIVVRTNAVDTALTCTLTSADFASQVANCSENVARIAITAGTRLAVSLTSDLVDAGTVTYTYTFEFD